MTKKAFPTSAVLAVFLALLCFAPAARAAGVEVSASLTDTTTDVGQPVQYQIKITGARSANPPREISVDGLGINYSGQSTQVQMDNFTVTMSVVHTYLVVPQRGGKFTIPPQTVEVGGKKFTTNAVDLDVGGGSTHSARTGAATGGKATSRDIFAELVVPKQTAFVGEVVPVEFRVYVDSRIRWNAQQVPTIGGDGFTVQKITKPQQNQVTRDGRDFDLVTFKTAITAAKAGTLTLGPAELECVAVIPQQRHRRSADPFDFFDDAFPGFGFGTQQQLTIKSEPVTINVKPLPTAQQPKSFSGAVGIFTLEESANPLHVKAGDPITVTTKINGRGNFDRVKAPEFEDESGWRTYPASGKFEADDDVGTSGTKTFATALIPNEPKTKLPPVRFSYFDPLTEKYVTLLGKPIPIAVEGQVPTPSAGVAAAATPAASPRDNPAPKNDILYIRTGSAHWGESFVALYRRPVFWIAQFAPLMALIGFVGVQKSRARQRDLATRRSIELRREKAELLKKAGREASEAAFLETVTRIFKLDTALQLGRDPNLLDVHEICAARNLDEETAAHVQEIFDEHSEWHYAGSAKGTGMISPKRRGEILEVVRRFEHAPANV